jgi:hypothetical protein
MCSRVLKCNCDKPHRINSKRSDGTPMSLWICPIHGNVFEDHPTKKEEKLK